MKSTFKLFWFYLTESFNEVRNNLNIFGIYILGLAAVSMVSNLTDFFYTKNDQAIKFMAKILFSLIPFLILSKILYVMKIRISGLGEYWQVLRNFLWYNILYFALVGLGLLIYFLPAFIIVQLTQTKMAFYWTLFLLVPFVYFLIFYSLMPFVAVFEDDTSKNYFSESKKLTKNNIALVVVNHIFSLLPHVFFFTQDFIKIPAWRFSSIFFISFPEAVFSLVMTITTVKIYYYLLNSEELQ